MLQFLSLSQCNKQPHLNVIYQFKRNVSSASYRMFLLSKRFQVCDNRGPKYLHDRQILAHPQKTSDVSSSSNPKYIQIQKMPYLKYPVCLMVITGWQWTNVTYAFKIISQYQWYLLWYTHYLSQYVHMRYTHTYNIYIHTEVLGLGEALERLFCPLMLHPRGHRVSTSSHLWYYFKKITTAS